MKKLSIILLILNAYCINSFAADANEFTKLRKGADPLAALKARKAAAARAIPARKASITRVEIQQKSPLEVALAKKNARIAVKQPSENIRLRSANTPQENKAMLEILKEEYNTLRDTYRKHGKEPMDFKEFVRQSEATDYVERTKSSRSIQEQKTVLDALKDEYQTMKQMHKKSGNEYIDFDEFVRQSEMADYELPKEEFEVEKRLNLNA